MKKGGKSMRSVKVMLLGIGLILVGMFFVEDGEG